MTLTHRRQEETMWLSTQRGSRLVPVVAIFMVATMVCGCNFFKASDPNASRPITVADGPASALVVEVNTPDPATAALLPALVEATARPDEHLAVIGEAGATVSSIAPGPVSVPAPAPPTPLPSSATTYQQAVHRHAVDAYRGAVAKARQESTNRTQARLTAWVRSLSLGSVRGSDSTVGGELAQGGGTLASLEETGLHLGPRKALVLLGDGPGTVPSTAPVSGLQGATVIVTGVAGNAVVVAGWQTALLATGAVRTVVLGPATADELTTMTRQGLGGSITDVLADAGLFPVDSATLLPEAGTQLSQLAHLLIVTYPGSAATVIGLCDPVGGATVDDLLSEQRALAVVTALEDLGVPADRLEPVGLGDTDPAAPPGPGGVQPQDRRVLVVVQPGG
jgi:outer membrane protein OmpA-like peptidoglycan-associated protein